MAGDGVCSVALGVIADLCVVSQDSKIGIDTSVRIAAFVPRLLQSQRGKPIHRFGNDVVAIVGLLTI
jgi:hypothetical protein